MKRPQSHIAIIIVGLFLMSAFTISYILLTLMNTYTVTVAVNSNYGVELFLDINATQEVSEITFDHLETGNTSKTLYLKNTGNMEIINMTISITPTVWPTNATWPLYMYISNWSQVSESPLRAGEVRILELTVIRHPETMAGTYGWNITLSPLR